MNKLYFANSYYSVPDYQAETEALLLNSQDIYTSNELVIWAARTLVKENKLPNKFLFVHQKKEYYIDNNGRFFSPIPSVWEDLLERLL